MSVQKQFCFTHSSGEDIYLFTLRNAKGTEVMISNYGAVITSFKIKNADGSINDIVLGFDKMEDYFEEGYLKQYPWFGCAVGRYANRIKNAEFELDAKKYILPKNNGNEILHGGHKGFDRRVWQFVASGESPNPFLELKYLSADGEEGFPGNLETLIRFELNEDELSYEYRAACDKPTVINLTHHSYFNLNNGKGTIHDHEIKINSSQMLEQDANLVATGNILPIENTPYDFKDFKKIGEGLKQIDEYDKSFDCGNKELSLMAEARSLQSGVQLQIYSTDPVVHFYSGKWIPSVKGKCGESYGPFSGFCLETHKHPNAINIPHFPSTVLIPGEIYYQETVYKITQS
ncbi:MAG: galactose mutarotase [Sphingobacteriales bacterium]|nr:galactose mutarotase [Sphingobacteriales bacterium]